MRYTKLDSEIIKYISEYGYATINQVARIFFKGHKWGYDEARLKLNRLHSNDYLKKSKDILGGKVMYYIDDIPSFHRQAVMELYSIIYERVDEILYFTPEEQNWKSIKKPDAHIVFENTVAGETYKRGFFIEIDKHKKTDLDIYDNLYESGKVQDWYKNQFKSYYFPKLMVITQRSKNVYKHTTNEMDTIMLDYTLDGIDSFL